MFDVRSLEHSTILYEASTPTSPKLSSSPVNTSSPLLKIAFDPNNAASLAVIHDGSPNVLLIDIRQPGIPVCEFKAHKAAVNGLTWTSESLATVSDDGLALVWDGSGAFNGSVGRYEGSKQVPKKGNAVQTRTVRDPMLCYEAGGEINSVASGLGGGKEWLACTVGNSVKVLRVT